SKVNPRAIQVMAEVGIDISQYHSKSVNEFLSDEAISLVVTVCDHARETCPVFLRPVQQIHIGFDDPAPFTNEPDEIALPKFREVRNAIRETLIEYLQKH
ncbi:MAG: arsenate reductase ArsC, partial [bacterium]|nr:arsenate reductase ArsC [bacterium]